MNTNKLYLYVSAIKHQQELDGMLTTAFRALNADNYVVGVADVITESYTQLVYSLLTQEQVGWLDYWIYDAEFGHNCLEFTLNNMQYNTQGMTFFNYWRTVNEV